jgi:hypothetical protein
MVRSVISGHTEKTGGRIVGNISIYFQGLIDHSVFKNIWSLLSKRVLR